jgi:hypothetical protein
MQTFLPFEDFTKSAESIDKKRCFKQVVECAQTLDVIEGRKSGWKNHPAVKMWVGYADLLKHYFNAFLKASKEIHKINTKYLYFENLPENPPRPWWLGNENFHRAMRARLIEKDENFYLPLFPEDKGFNEGKYFWPVMESKTFRII